MTGVPDLVEEKVALGERTLHVVRPRRPEDLIDERAFAREEFLPYWADVWPSGVELARLLAGRALDGRRVLELGCGLALPSIAAALAGADVLATDWSPDALAAAEGNARRNGARLRTAPLAWTRPALPPGGPWDLVLAADVLYEERNAAPLLDLLPRVTAPGAEILLADPGRPPLQGFLGRARARGWHCSEVRATTRPVVTVHRLTPARGRADRRAATGW